MGFLGSLLPCGFLEENSKIRDVQEQVLRFSFNQFLNRNDAFFVLPTEGGLEKGVGCWFGVEFEGEESEAGMRRFEA
jgi:hypothetical protein